jgi:prolyl oligopeptidase PreP (S9A serine peptidase family)
MDMLKKELESPKWTNNYLVNLGNAYNNDWVETIITFKDDGREIGEISLQKNNAIQIRLNQTALGFMCNGYKAVKSSLERLKEKYRGNALTPFTFQERQEFQNQEESKEEQPMPKKRWTILDIYDFSNKGWVTILGSLILLSAEQRSWTLVGETVEERENDRIPYNATINLSKEGSDSYCEN